MQLDQGEISTLFGLLAKALDLPVIGGPPEPEAMPEPEDGPELEGRPAIADDLEPEPTSDAPTAEPDPAGPVTSLYGGT